MKNTTFYLLPHSANREVFVPEQYKEDTFYINYRWLPNKGLPRKKVPYFGPLSDEDLKDISGVNLVDKDNWFYMMVVRNLKEEDLTYLKLSGAFSTEKYFLTKVEETCALYPMLLRDIPSEKYYKITSPEKLPSIYQDNLKTIIIEQSIGKDGLYVEYYVLANNEPIAHFLGTYILINLTELDRMHLALLGVTLTEVAHVEHRRYKRAINFGRCSVVFSPQNQEGTEN